ncbi:MAG TPA: AraC family transcriptional regulator [Opitutaceae bacterium]|jgi:AraC family L-rhamnose operon transcriptional activator RhaR|nr:AraC family transcriptional regulator [Opitutaceae bacterium]
MNRYRSLLLDRANIRMPGLRILSFALHRHLPKRPSIEPHRHPWSQVLLYLDGQGRQIFQQGAAHVEPGTLVVLPPGVLHSFQRTASRMPQSLIINFHLRGESGQAESIRNVNCSELARVRGNLARLVNLQTESRGILHWEGAMVILELLITMLRAAGWLERARSPSVGETSPAIRQLVASMDPSLPLSYVAKRSGYHRDHLNRLVKKETGLTLGQLRTQQRLAKSCELLAAGIQVREVAATVGLLDQSYFARWFRRQTGRSPSRWKRGQ